MARKMMTKRSRQARNLRANCWKAIDRMNWMLQILIIKITWQHQRKSVHIWEQGKILNLNIGITAILVGWLETLAHAQSVSKSAMLAIMWFMQKRAHSSVIAKTVVIANSRQIYQAYNLQASMGKVYLLMETLKKHITNKACSVSHRNQLKLQDSLVAMVVICHRISLIHQNNTKTDETVQTASLQLLSIDQCQDWVIKRNENLVKPHLVSNQRLVLVP